jgi:hypothetical protein
MQRLTEFGARERPASPRRLILRLVMLDLTHDFFKKLADSLDDPVVGKDTVHEVERPLNDEEQGATGRESPDPAALCLLRNMFLLLDQWDRTMHKGFDQSQDSSETCAITVDLKSP